MLRCHEPYRRRGRVEIQIILEFNPDNNGREHGHRQQGAGRTVFLTRLPKRRSPMERKAMNPRHTVAEPSGRISNSPWLPTILIAEDSADSREMMQVLLETRGYQVITAANGIHAIEMAVRNRPDAMLLDLQLPKLDGLSVTRNLRLNPTFKNVPIIIISGHDPNRFRQEAMDAGCDDYFLKPIDFDRLQLVLDQTVPRRRQRVKCA